MSEDDKLTQFRKMVGSSRHLTERHAKLTDQVKQSARELGVHLSDEEIAGSWTFRTAVYGNHQPDFDEVFGDLDTVPAVVEWRAVKRLVERLEAGDPDAAEEIGGTPVERLRFAREHGLTNLESQDKKLNDAEIASIRDPGRRIAAYRAKGDDLNKQIQTDQRFMSPAAKIAKFRREGVRHD